MEGNPHSRAGGSEFGRISPLLNSSEIDLPDVRQTLLFDASTDAQDAPELHDNDIPFEINDVIDIEISGPPRPPEPGEYPHVRRVDDKRRQRIFNRYVLKTQA